METTETNQDAIQDAIQAQEKPTLIQFANPLNEIDSDLWDLAESISCLEAFDGSTEVDTLRAKFDVLTKAYKDFADYAWTNFNPD